MDKLLFKFLQIIPRKPDQFKIVMGGTRDSGKSTILYSIAYKSASTTIPTPEFNKEVFKYRSRIIHLWDLGYNETRRFFYWKHLSAGSKGVIYVVDTSSAENVGESKAELDRILKLNTLKGLPLLVYANKIDEKEMDAEEVASKLNLFSINDREWFIQPSNAIERSGLFEGFDWLLNTIRQTNKQSVLDENTEGN